MKRILLFLGLFFSINAFAQPYPQANTLVTISEENFGKITPNQSNLYFIWNAQGGSFWRLRPNDRTSAASSTIRIHPQGSRFERLNVTGASNVGGTTPGVSSITLSQISDFNTVWPPKFSDIQQRPSVYPSDWLTTANRPEVLTNINTYLNQKANNTRAITAGTGLTGGGDLSVDRSFSVVPNSTVQKTEIYNAGSIVGTRKATNFTSSGTAALTITDDPANDRVNINISATGGSGGMAEPSTNGMVVRDGAGTSVARTITGSTGIAITNGTGVSGNPTIAPANDLLALENLATTGFPKRTATDTWSMGAVDLGTSDATGTLAAGRMPALTGDITSSAGGTATTYNSVVPSNKGGAGTVSGLLKANGSGTVSAAIANTDYLTPTGSAAALTNFPTLNQNTTGTASNITGTAAIANGGTGATTAANARTNLGLVIGTDVAPIASPALTGTPTAPTATTGTNTTQIANTAFVKNAVDTRVLIIANVATLKTTTGVSGQIATTSGYYAPNDGGGNSYYWNATSTATQDNGFVIQVTGVSTGRWIAIDQSIANVKQFGAKGDSTTNDLSFIQAAANSIEKGTLFFPKGNYLINGTFSISKNATGNNSQSNFTIEATGARIVTTNSTLTPVFKIFNTKRLRLSGIEIVGTTAIEGLWWSTLNDCKFKLMTFNKNDTDYFNECYWDDFRSCQFTGIEIYTGSSLDLSEFNAISFYQCLFRDTDYLIKLYGTESAQNVSFYNCDYSNVGTKILYVDTQIKNAQFDFYSCYFDDFNIGKGFPDDLKGLEVNFHGNSVASNITSDFRMKDASKMSMNFSYSPDNVGNRMSSRHPTTTMNLIKNGDLSYGDAGFFVNGSLTKAIITDTAYFNKVLRVTGNTIAETYFESIPVPYTGTYSFVVIGKNSGGKTLTPVYSINVVETLYTPVNFTGTTYNTSGCSVFLNKGDVFKISWYTQNTTGNQFEIGYVGLTYGKIGLLGTLPHPIAEAAVNSASVTYNPPSITNGGSTTTTVTLQGASLGDFVIANFSNSLSGISLTGYVSASNTITCLFSNSSGSSVDLASGTLKVKILKQ